MNRKHLLHTKIILCLLILSLTLNGCAFSSGKTSAQKNFDSFLDESFKTLISQDSITLHSHVANPSAYGIDKESFIKFPDLSEQGMTKSLQTLKSMQKELNGFSVDSLSNEQKYIALTLQDKLSKSIEHGEKYPYYETYLGQSSGLVNISILLSDYSFEEEADVKAYQKLLTKLPEYFEQIVSYEARRQKKGFTVSEDAFDDTLTHINRILNASGDDNLYLSTFSSRIANLDSMDEEQKASYVDKNKNLVENTVLPAYQKMYDSLEKTIVPSSKTPSICQSPDGSNYYDFLLKSNVGTNRDGDGCIELLTKALAEDQENLQQLAEDNEDLALEYSCALPVEKDAKTIVSVLKNDTLIEFPSIENVSFSIEETSSSLSNLSASAYYLVKPFDSEGVNHIYMNKLSSIDLKNFATIAHESYPGHMYQKNYLYQNMYHPIQTILSTEGYDEGWGQYAEYYSYDFMAFSNVNDDIVEPLRKYMRIHARQSLILSSLSDLYVNYKGYDLAQLKEFLGQYGVDESSCEDIYSYVCQNPSQYLTYGIGYYEFMQLLNQAKGNDEFSMEDFHEEVLSYGSCPFYLLSSFMKESQTSTKN